MLLSSFFVLNRSDSPPYRGSSLVITKPYPLYRTDQVNQHTLYPFIHSFSNVRTAPSITTPISIPDVQPSDLPEPSDFSLVAGDFIEIYGVTDEDIRSGKVSDGKTSQEGQWNAVLTCFFIDTVSA